MIHKHEVIMIPVGDLKPYENNARTHSESQVEQLTKSIKQFGFNNPILVQDDLTVVAGHGRLLAAKKLGMTEVPVIKLRHLTREQVKAYVLADNKLALNAGWDDEILKAELQAIQNAGEVDMEAIGFSDAEMAQLLQEAIVDNAAAEWKDMPEYINEDKTAFRSIIIHMAGQAEVAEFAELIKQNITPKTKSLWYPEQVKMDTKSKTYGD